MTLELAGELIAPLGAKALWWPAARTLFAADLHWGKADSFRAVGVAVPTAHIHADLARLARVLADTDATRLVLLGDLFHDRASQSAEVLAAVGAWRAEHPGLGVTLIRGNHDARSGDPPAAWGFECVAEPWPLGPFACRHYPEPTPGLYTVAGHLHPSVTIYGRGRQKLRLPCFHFGPAVGTLPAFGSFTGTADAGMGAGDRVFAVADGEVVRVQ